MYLFFNQKSGRNRGFTLLLAALVSAIVLSLGASIFTIARKQVTLSSLGRDSQFAFYAADTIAECALYFDIRFAAFATSSQSAAMGPITCDNVTVISVLLSSNDNSAQSSFQMTLFTQDEAGAAQAGNCAKVIMTKNSTAAPYTVLRADGYSTPCATLTTSARTLQRSIEIQY